MSLELEPGRTTTAVLDADPDLGSAVPELELRAARQRSLAVVLEVPTPVWNPSSLQEGRFEGWLGLFVLDGVMLRGVGVGKRTACELFGPGDLVRPWDADGEYEPLPITISWRVLKPTKLAVLDEAFALRMARWPCVTARIVGRVARRARHLALAQAVTHLPRAYARVLMLFWLLAERWGRVGPEGVRISLPLTHEVLAMLIGAHRPTVTIALQRLAAADLLHRERRDSWLLTHEAVERLQEPESLRLIEGEAGEEDESALLLA
jgi:CRP/FNR family cyclic AMP-dependent transcriptional regulator